MRQRKPAQPDLFKTAHEVLPSRRTTALVLLKTLLIEAISAQTSAATAAEPSTAEGDDVEIGEDVGE